MGEPSSHSGVAERRLTEHQIVRHIPSSDPPAAARLFESGFQRPTDPDKAQSGRSGAWSCGLERPRRNHGGFMPDLSTAELRRDQNSFRPILQRASKNQESIPRNITMDPELASRTSLCHDTTGPSRTRRGRHRESYSRRGVLARPLVRTDSDTRTQPSPTIEFMLN